jgi:hypothetical protein
MEQVCENLNFLAQVLTTRIKGSDLVEQVVNLMRSAPDLALFAETQEVWNPSPASLSHSYN